MVTVVTLLCEGKNLMPHPSQKSLSDLYRQLVNREEVRCGLLPIWSCFANLIYAGNKKFEYRKQKPRNDITIFLLYETKPVGCITGAIAISHILRDKPEVVWRQTQKLSGLTEQSFFSYFSGSNSATAWGISHAIKFPTTFSLIHFNIKAPQSVRYLL